MKIHFQTTFKSQIELLPRFTVIYGGKTYLLGGMAIEFLWFSLAFLESEKRSVKSDTTL